MKFEMQPLYSLLNLPGFEIGQFRCRVAANPQQPS
jgi:hypothetical protein